MNAESKDFHAQLKAHLEGLNENISKLERVAIAAVWVVNMFDQANTNSVIYNLGSRGALASDAVDDLRADLVSVGLFPILKDPPYKR